MIFMEQILIKKLSIKSCFKNKVRILTFIKLNQNKKAMGVMICNIFYRKISRIMKISKYIYP